MKGAYYIKKAKQLWLFLVLGLFFCFSRGCVFGMDYSSVHSFVNNCKCVETDSLILTPIDAFSEEDRKFVLNHIAHMFMDYGPDQLRLMGLKPAPKKIETPEQALEYIKPSKSNLKDYVIQTKEIMTQPFVGYIQTNQYTILKEDVKNLSFDSIFAPKDKVIELNIFIDPGFMNKGIGTQALFKIISELLKCSDVSGIYCRCFKENKACMKLLEKVFGKIAEQNSNIKYCSRSLVCCPQCEGGLTLIKTKEA